MRNSRRGPKPGLRKENPEDPRLVRKILKLRDEKKMSFREIRDAIKPTWDMSHMGVYTLYKRWKDWRPST